MLSAAARLIAAALITSIALLAAAPAQADAAGTKKLTRYAASEACAPTKALSEDSQPSSGSVTAQLPAPPAGQKWRVGFAVNTQGFVVRIFIGDQQVGSGIVRWDRSFRFLLFLEDYDIAGSQVDISGRIEGCDINDKNPVSRISGTLDGPVQLADSISILKGDLVWDRNGIQIKGEARIACATSGTLKGAASIEYQSADTWTLHILGSSEGPTCVMEEGFSIGDATIGGTIKATGGTIAGKLAGRAKVAAPILPFGEWDATFELLMSGTVKATGMSFSADASNPAGFAKVAIGPDGNLVITVNLNAPPGGGPVGPAADAYVDPGPYLNPASSRPVVTRCRIPSIKRGSTLTTTRRAMTRANCKTRVKRVRSHKVRAGRVVGLVQKQGKTFNAGTTVTVRVSSGPGPRCRIPSVKRGSTLASVRRAMTKAGCKVRVKRVRSAKVRKGRVVGLTQKRGKTFTSGTRVTVRVSAGSSR